jgi:RNA polymerase sigma-70 factor, ECF subfamily
MSADASDLSLVRRVQRGDKGAFDALVLKYQHKLVKLVMRYVRNPAEAVSHSYQHRQERRGLP